MKTTDQHKLKSKGQAPVKANKEAKKNSSPKLKGAQKEGTPFKPVQK